MPSPHAPYGDVGPNAPSNPDADPGRGLKVPPTPKSKPMPYVPRAMGGIASKPFTPEQVREVCIALQTRDYPFHLTELPQYKRKFQTRGWNVSEAAWYTFVRLPEFFQTATVSRGTGPIKELEKRTDLEAAIGAIKNPFPGVTNTFGTITLDEYMDKAEIAGLIVAYKGKIVYEKLPRLQQTDKHIWWSISKTTVGLMIGLLEADGLVNVHKSVAHYIPRLRGTDWEGSTVLDCLHMASGMEAREHDDHEDGKLEGNVPYKGFYQYVSKFNIMNQKHTKDYDVLEFLANLKRQKPAGAAYEYSCIDTQVLDWVVQCVTGKTFYDAFSERVWSKIGAQADAVIMQSPLGEVWSPAGFGTTLRDLARYGIAWTENSWRAVSDERIVPQSLLDKIKAPWRPQIVDRGWLGYYGLRNMYGEEGRKAVSHVSYQIDAVWKDGAFLKTGANDQGLFVLPSKDLVVGYFGAHNQSSTPTQTWGRAIADSGLFDDPSSAKL